jgi:DNA mismatch endonuclease (patch repair protein)
MANSSRKRQAPVPARPASSTPSGIGRIDAEISAVRSRIMRSIRQKNTKPEILVRKIIHGMGFRFRLHQKLPGRPDIVMSRHRVIIQVHGCFWHQHGCAISNVPRTREEYWLPKLARNTERDRTNLELLTSMGWRVIIVWECDLQDMKSLSTKLRKFIGAKRTPKHSRAVLRSGQEQTSYQERRALTKLTARALS